MSEQHENEITAAAREAKSTRDRAASRPEPVHDRSRKWPLASVGIIGSAALAAALYAAKSKRRD